ncbi:DNA repair protein XRCC4 isoform X2 [Sceloporus undulatus]|uniref:DNA repair protein XRCC4 isoform X2 n=1 Tax=Sceloporus undulatus TaxID=8520 RepID=UPI001C4B3BAC|nr:DNA repair protein XRCC4 isoform X2 [Sceloporus undulatus]
MEKKVRRIYPVSDPGTTYFLQIAWQKDLCTGFDVTLTDGQSAWIERVSKEDISKEAADIEMEQEKYTEELRKVLLSEGGLTDTYSFDISKEGINEDFLHFSYEKKLKDLAFRLGSLKLQRVSSPAEVISKLISYCLDCIAGLHAKNNHLQRENKILLSDLTDLQGKLQKCVEAKEELETDLYTRFILVLNEKKTKIRNLQKCLKEAEETVVEDTQARVSVAAQESKVEREVYEGSTDEESENLAEPSTSSPVKPRRDSFLSSPDITDVAPSRKRRQRVRNIANTEPKVALYEAQNSSKEKLDSSLPKSSGKQASSKGIATEAGKNSGDPEDLFDDI